MVPVITIDADTDARKIIKKYSQDGVSDVKEESVSLPGTQENFYFVLPYQS